MRDELTCFRASRTEALLSGANCGSTSLLAIAAVTFTLIDNPVSPETSIGSIVAGALLGAAFGGISSARGDVNVQNISVTNNELVNLESDEAEKREDLKKLEIVTFTPKAAAILMHFLSTDTSVSPFTLISGMFVTSLMMAGCLVKVGQISHIKSN